MTDRETILKWAHLNRRPTGRAREIIENQRRALQKHVEQIWAEQELRNAALPRAAGPPLEIAPRYAAARHRRRP